MSGAPLGRVADALVDQVLGVIARLALGRARALVALDSAALDRHLARIAAILRWIDREHPALLGVAELRELIAGDPVALGALRKVLLNARDGQALSTLRGALRHHVLPRPLLPSDVGVPPRPRRTRDLGGLRVGLVGASADLDELEQAYSNAGARVVRLEAPMGTSWLRSLEQLNAVEIGGATPVRTDALAAALDRGVAVSLHREAAPPAAELDALARSQGAAMARFRLFDPLLWYPPFVALADLLERNVLGEVTTVRVRAAIGGTGGERRPAPLEPGRWASHPAFDRFLALARLGGPITSLTGYASFADEGGTGRGSGQAVLALAHAHPGRYSHLELVYTPALAIRSDREPYDLSIEVSGTDGIAWLRRGIAKRIEQAPLEVRVGKLHFTVDAAAGLDEDWGAAFGAAAHALSAQMSRRGPPPMVPGVWRTALGARSAAPLAVSLAHRLVL